MSKNLLIKALGVAAILFAVSLNVRHASDNYGLRNNSLWSIVAAQTTSTGSGTGGSSGGNGGMVYCVWEECDGFDNCSPEYINYYLHCVTTIKTINSIPEAITICQYTVEPTGGGGPNCRHWIGRIYKCSVNYPGTLNYVYGKTCEDCNSQCVETSTSY